MPSGSAIVPDGDRQRFAFLRERLAQDGSAGRRVVAGRRSKSSHPCSAPGTAAARCSAAVSVPSRPTLSVTVTSPATFVDRVVGARAREHAPCRCPPSSRSRCCGRYVMVPGLMRPANTSVLSACRLSTSWNGAVGAAGFGARSCTFSQASPSRMSSPPRPSRRSLPAPPRMMLPPVNDVAPAEQCRAARAIRAIPAAVSSWPLHGHRELEVDGHSVVAAQHVVEVPCPTAPRSRSNRSRSSLSGGLTSDDAGDQHVGIDRHGLATVGDPVEAQHAFEPVRCRRTLPTMMSSPPSESKSSSPVPAMRTSWPPFGSFWNWLFSSPTSRSGWRTGPRSSRHPRRRTTRVRPVARVDDVVAGAAEDFRRVVAADDEVVAFVALEQVERTRSRR